MLNRLKPKFECSRNVLILMRSTTIAQTISIAELVSNKIMSLPMNPYLSDDEIGYIATALNKKDIL